MSRQGVGNEMAGFVEVPSLGDVGLSTVPGGVATIDATPAVLATYTPGNDGGFGLMALVLAKKDDGNMGLIWIAALFKRVAGVVTKVGVTRSVVANLNDGVFLPTADFAIDGTTKIIQIVGTGVAATNITWKANATVSVN